MVDPLKGKSWLRFDHPARNISGAVMVESIAFEEAKVDSCMA